MGMEINEYEREIQGPRKPTVRNESNRPRSPPDERKRKRAPMKTWIKVILIPSVHEYQSQLQGFKSTTQISTQSLGILAMSWVRAGCEVAQVQQLGAKEGEPTLLTHPLHLLHRVAPLPEQLDRSTWFPPNPCPHVRREVTNPQPVKLYMGKTSTASLL